MMGVKYLEAVKQRLHATKQWSPDKIRVWQLAYDICLLFFNALCLFDVAKGGESNGYFRNQERIMGILEIKNII